jgi:hypothetical protein
MFARKFDSFLNSCYGAKLSQLAPNLVGTEQVSNVLASPSYPKIGEKGMPMPKAKKLTGSKNNTSTPAKAHVILKGEARALYERFRDESGKTHKDLTEAIRASQTLSKEDFDIRINTRD